MKRSFSTGAWLGWLLSASLLTLFLRNPLYHLIILLASKITLSAFGKGHRPLNLPFWRISLVILAFSVTFNVLLVHIGQTVFFALPRGWWLVGGPLTLEAAVFGAAGALVLITLLSIFITFNALVPASDLVALLPRALSNVSVVVLIAVTYVPETLQQLERVRQAQALRGHRVSGVRDWQPIVIPLLIGGLERSMNLAETMVARGYGDTADKQLPTGLRWLLLSGLGLLFGGWLLSFWQAQLGWMLVLAGAAMLVLGYLRAGSRSRRTRYEPMPWRAADWLLLGVSIFPLLMVALPLPGIAETSLAYSPYPLATLPPFDPVVGMSLALLAAPTLLLDD